MDFLGFLGLFGDAVGGALSTIVTWTEAGFATLFGDIAGVWGVLQNFITWAKNAIGAIVNFISSLWQWLRDNVLTPIIDTIKKIHDWLKNLLAPIIKWIQTERAILQHLFDTYIRPILNFIQSVRKFLLIFRLLGFKWAKQLDAYLVSLENKINAAFLGAWKNLNILADWINFIVDPLGLFQPSVLFGSIARSAGALFGILWGAQNNPLSGSQLATNSAAAHQFDATQVKQGIHLESTVGSQPEDLTNLQSVEVVWANMGIVV